MDKKQVSEALEQVKKNSQKRNFKQSIELIINLKGLNLKKQDQQINTFSTLHYNWGKKVSVCAFVGPELKSQAESCCDETVLADNFSKYTDKKLLKKLARKHDFFIAQANIMPKVATTFGKVLGPLGKMPNPKIGAILPPNGNVKAVYDKLQLTKKLMSRANPVIQCSVGTEDMKDEEIIDNALTVYNSLVHELPNEVHNIKNIFMKMTMGKSFMVGSNNEEEEPKKEVKEEKKTEPSKEEDKPEEKKEESKEEK